MKRLAQASAIGAGLGAFTYCSFQLGAWVMDRAYRTYDHLMRKRHDR